jgi:ubiquinone/menaquinone biosynthesis C-methylase UbiE
MVEGTIVIHSRNGAEYRSVAEENRATLLRFLMYRSPALASLFQFATRKKSTMSFPWARVGPRRPARVSPLRASAHRSLPMVTTDKVFAGSIPDLYEKYLVPLIFEPYALDLAGRVASLNPASILETAAGTGVVTRAIAAALPQTAHLCVTDLNLAMLDVARSRLSHDRRIEWKQADALQLPFDNASFDVVVCQFGAMFFPDKEQGFREAHRVLKPSGRFLFNVWGDIVHNEFADVVTKSLAEFFPADPPRFLARTPHGHHDVKPIGDALRAAGFTNVISETVDHISRCLSPHDAAFAYCEGTPLRSEIEARDASRLGQATDHATQALERQFGAGPIEGHIQAIVFTATP